MTGKFQQPLLIVSLGVVFHALPVLAASDPAGAAEQTGVARAFSNSPTSLEPALQTPIRVAPPPQGLSPEQENDPDRIAGMHTPPKEHLAPLDVFAAETARYRREHNIQAEPSFLERLISNGPDVSAREAIAKGDFRLIRQSTGYRPGGPPSDLWEQPEAVICSQPVPLININFGCIGAPFSVYRALLQYNVLVYAAAPESVKAVCRVDDAWVAKDNMYEAQRAAEWARLQQLPRQSMPEPAP